MDLDPIHALDEIVNFVPKLPTRIIDRMHLGSSGLALVPVAILGYGAGCVAQGTAASYAMMHAGHGPFASLATGAAVTLVPPVLHGLRSIFYDQWQDMRLWNKSPEAYYKKYPSSRPHRDSDLS